MRRLVVVHRLAVQHACEHVQILVRVVRIRDVEEVLADQLARAHAVDRARGRVVHETPPAIRVRSPHQILARVQDLAVLPLRLAARLLRPPQ